MTSLNCVKCMKELVKKAGAPPLLCVALIAISLHKSDDAKNKLASYKKWTLKNKKKKYASQTWITVTKGER